MTVRASVSGLAVASVAMAFVCYVSGYTGLSKVDKWQVSGVHVVSRGFSNSMVARAYWPMAWVEKRVRGVDYMGLYGGDVDNGYVVEVP
jgi:hypothetical protein